MTDVCFMQMYKFISDRCMMDVYVLYICKFIRQMHMSYMMDVLNLYLNSICCLIKWVSNKIFIT